MKKQKKVLIVDDEPVSLKMLSGYLRDINYEFEQAENGKKALQILEKNPTSFGVVILDRLMPHMSGIELLNIMKQNKKLVKIPVVMLTGLDNNEDIIEAIQAGAFDYLTKPVEKDLFLKLVTQAMA